MSVENVKYTGKERHTCAYYVCPFSSYLFLVIRGLLQCITVLAPPENVTEGKVREFMIARMDETTHDQRERPFKALGSERITKRFGRFLGFF